MTTKRDTLIEAAKQFVKDGQLNMSTLRKENDSLYVRICAVFDSVDDFKKAIAPIQCVYSKERAKRRTFRSDTRKIPIIESGSLRNVLAYEKLTELLQSMTFEEIGKKYGFTKQGVHELNARLHNFFEKSIDEK